MSHRAESRCVCLTFSTPLKVTKTSFRNESGYTKNDIRYAKKSGEKKEVVSGEWRVKSGEW